MDYVLNWSNDTLKPSFIVKEGEVDIKTTSLSLTGFRTTWGEIHNENFIKLLEHFASNIAPENPTVGQIWFNSSKNSVNVYYNSKWNELATGSSPSPIPPTSPKPGDFWYDLDNDLLRVYTKDGNWAYFAAGLGSPAGGGGACACSGGSSTIGYNILSPTFTPFNGPINIPRTQTVKSLYSSEAEADVQISKQSYYSFSTIASGTGLPAILTSYVSFLNNILGQFKVKQNKTERWDDSGLTQLGSSLVGLANAKAAPNTSVILYKIEDNSIYANHIFCYSISVVYSSADKSYNFYVSYKILGVGAPYSSSIPTNAIKINSVLQYLRPIGVGSTMPVVTQVSFG